jgi:hypothetical protein
MYTSGNDTHGGEYSSLRYTSEIPALKGCLSTMSNKSFSRILQILKNIIWKERVGITKFTQQMETKKGCVKKPCN